MKKIFNKFTKILLLALLVVSELMTPIKVLAAINDEVIPQKGDVGINETISNTNEVSVTKGSLTNPGDVQVTKTVKKSGEGKYNVEFEVKGKDVTTTTTTSKPIYAVVLFDKSGSMEREECVFWFFGCEEVKFSSAVNGAKTFANSLLRNFSNANLALIEFSTNVNTVREFDNANFDNVSFGSPYGGTNLTGALNEAKSLLDGIGNDYTKYIVVISDGAPTGNNGIETQEAANIAINTANSIKEDESIKIYSIGYETDSTTSNTLKSIASGDDYFMEADADAIANKFEEVASSITNSAFAGINATLVDNIGTNFTVTATSSENINVGSGNISTTIENITESGTKVSFQVEINGDEADGWVNVNEGFNLTYTDVNGDTQNITYTADEPQPQVYWERNSYNYVVNYYKDEITNTSDKEHYLGTSGNLSAYNGDIIVLNDDEKNVYLPEAGYKLSDNNVYSIIIDKTKDNIINVLYEKIDLKYSVNYLFESDNGYIERDDVLKINNINAKYGDEVSYNNYLLEDIPTGYELNTTMTEKNNNGIYTITDNNTVINIFYSKKNLTYDVKYLFEDLDGNYVELSNVSGINNIATKYGKVISYSDHLLTVVPEGYALDTAKNIENSNGKYTIIDNDTTIYVYYKRNYYRFTVNYFFNGEFDEVYSYSNDAIYGSILNAANYRLEIVNNEYLLDRNNADNKDYFLDPSNDSNNTSITVGINNNMKLYYIDTFFDNNNESISKTSSADSNKVTSSNQIINYKINYSNIISNVREGDIITIEVIDTLPFKGIVTNLTNGCIYDNDKTISCKFIENASEFKSEYDINKEIEYSVIYEGFASISSSNNSKLVNEVNGKTSLTSDNVTKESNGAKDNNSIDVEIYGNLIVHHYEKGTTNSVYSDEITNSLVGTSYETNYRNDITNYIIDSDNIPSNVEGKYAESDTVVTYYYIRKKGTLFVSYIDEDGNELDSYTYTDLVGNKYSTEEKQFEGYEFKSSSNNTEGVFVADETIYIEYVYSKSNTNYEEIPPQTGYDNININYMKYVLLVLLLIVDKKRVVKNN